MECPVCSTLSTEKNQHFCLTCAWEFEYYLQELNTDEFKQYNRRLKIQKDLYLLSKKDEISVSKSRKSQLFMGGGIALFLFVLISFIFKMNKVEVIVPIEENNTRIVIENSQVVEESITKKISKIDKLSLEITNTIKNRDKLICF